MTKPLSLAIGLALGLGVAPALADRVAVLVFDASGSMWNRVEGDLSRIEVARDVMGDYFASRDGAVPLSVIAYGHNRRGDCRDIEVVAPMGQAAPGDLEARLRALMPRGMTPLTDSLALARDQIPPTAEAADIILVTDGLETCGGDPCALAARLAGEGIDIRAHVVGFGLTRVEVEALSCITDQTGGMLFETNSGSGLAEALRQVSAAEPEPAPIPEPEPAPAPEAAFDIGDKAEAGFVYRIRWNGEARNVDYMGFVPQGESRAPAGPSYSTIGGTGAAPTNPATRTAPTEPGMYDLILVTARDGVIARQAVEVVAPHMGFEAIGSVEPGARVRFPFRGPERLEERIVIARPDDPLPTAIGDWGYALHKNGVINLTVPEEPGEYEIRYLNARQTEILFSRRFGVGIAFADADLTSAADLAAAAAAATQGAASQDDIASVSATFRLPPGLPDSPLSWDGIPLDADMSPEAWAPMDTGHIISGEFEPGNWRITARAPGEVVFAADLAIFPGQESDFTLTLADDSLDSALVGGWTLWAIPPRGIDDQPMNMAGIDLRLTEERQDYIGRITPAQGMGPAATAGDLSSVLIGDGYLHIDFEQPDILPDPFRLALAPQGPGFVGTMTMGPQSMPVALWPEDVAPDLPLWLNAAFGPEAGNDADLSDIAFTCTEPRCEVVIDGLSGTLEEGWSMTPPAWTGATTGAPELAQPSVDFIGPGGTTMHLNPHQWLADNGPCMASGAGQLCLWRDAPPHAAAAAIPLAMSLQLVARDAALRPATPATRHAEGPGSMAVEPDDGSFFAGHGPWQAGAEVMAFAQRGQDRRPGDRVVVLGPGLEPVAGTAARWLDDHRAAVLLPDVPGGYALAVFDADAGSLRAVTQIAVETDPQPHFSRYNPNPRTGRSYGFVVQGRMVLTDRIAIRTTSGDTVIEASLYDALRGEIRLPEGAFGAMELVYVADGAVLAQELINVGGPPVLASAGGSDGAAQIVMSGEVVPGGTVQVVLRGMIPADLGTIGFIRAGSPDLTILETGSRVSPQENDVSVNVPDGPGPWALRLVDQNLITIAEITPGAAPSGDPGTTAGLIPITLPEGMTADDLIDILLPELNAE